jgi:hypothetical protein
MSSKHFLVVGEQIQLAQSASVLQRAPVTQALLPVLAQMPPQSVSLSSWFLVLSAQVGTTHVLLEQILLVQSAPSAHLRLSAHGLQLPPQSLSVSSASRVPLMQ